VKAPRICAVADEPAPFAGELPASLGPLRPYADTRQNTAELPLVTAASTLPRLRPRAETLPLLAIALLGASVVTLALALTVLFRAAREPGSTTAPQVPAAVMTTSGRDGAGTIHCAWDIVTISVSRAPAFAGSVMTGSVDTPNGTLRLVLRPIEGGFEGHLYINDGLLSTQPRMKGIAVAPDTYVVVRIDGLPDARELRVSGRETRLGSRSEGPCS